LIGIYPYCAVPAGHTPPVSVVGLEGAQVELVTTGNIGLWVSRLPRPTGSVQLIQDHNRVVEAAVTDEVTPVPLRFGQWLADDATLHASMADKAPSYEQKLRDFAGCLEFGIRVIDPAGPEGARDVHPGKPASGFAYMQALRESSRLAEQRRALAEQVGQSIRDALHDLVRSEREEEARTSHAVVALSHLVARTNFNEYRERARQFRQTFPALRLLLSGPWAPYSFA
jgi:hypothetical protein